MKPHQNRKLVAGIGFILLGLAVFYLRSADVGLGHGYITVFIGGLLMIGYFWTKSPGFLVPACLFLALGIGSIGDRSFLDWDRGDFFPIGLGFLAMPVVRFIYERKTMIWPLVPGLILCFGAFRYMQRWFELAAENWPLIFVVVGLLIILSALFRRSEASDG